MKFSLIPFLLASMILAEASILRAQVPHSIYGKVENQDHTLPTSLSMTAFVSSRPDEILTQNSPGCSYDASTGNWIIQCASFTTAWQAGESVHLEFSSPQFHIASHDVSLTASPYDYAGSIILRQHPVSVTINSTPSGLTLTVDQSQITTPQTLTWLTGSSHTVSAESVQNIGIHTEHHFDRWEQGGDQTQTILVGDNNMTLNALYNTRYWLEIESSFGDAQGAGWYDEGASATVSLTTPDGSGHTRQIFSHWSGDLSGSTQPATVMMNRPKTVTAHWTTQHRVEIISEQGTATGSGWYNEGSSATFAIASALAQESENIRHQFAGWIGSGVGAYSGSDMSHSITVNNPITETAQWMTQYRLNVLISPPLGGTVTRSPDEEWFTSDQSVTLTAQSAIDYVFRAWSGDVSGTSNPIPITLSSPQTITANFSQYRSVTIQTNPPGLTFTADGQQYSAPHTFQWPDGTIHTLSAQETINLSSDTRRTFASWSQGGSRIQNYAVPAYNQILTASYQTEHMLTLTSAHGTLTGGGWHPANTTVPFSVTSPEESGTTRYMFTHWSGDYSGTSTSGSVYLNEPKTITAQWKNQYQLTITSEWGSPQGAGWYDAGVSATFYVSSPHQEDDIRHLFTRWSGDYSGTSANGSMTMNSAKAITAHWKTQYKLTQNKTPSYGGTIQTNPSGDWFDANTQAVVTAIANSGYLFTGWQGALSGTDNPAQILMSSPKTVDAQFGREVTITIHTNPAGRAFTADGSVYTAPKSFQWAENSIHSLDVSSPQESGPVRYQFTSWSNGAPQAHNYTVPGSNFNLVATFTTQYYLDLISDYGNPQGEGWHNANTSVSIGVTTPHEAGTSRYLFQNWSGDHNSTSASTTLLMNGPKTVQANWRTQFFLDLVSDWGNPVGEGWYYQNAQANVSVTSPVETDDSRHIFQSWSGDYSGTSASAVIAMDTPKQVQANWQTQYYLSMQMQPAGAGTVTPASPGQWMPAYQNTTISATAAQGYQFTAWSGDIPGTLNPATVYMDGPKSMTANFGRVVQIIINTEPQGRPFLVNDEPYTAPHTFTWLSQDFHTLSVASPQDDGQGSRYTFNSWSDGGDQTHIYQVPAANASMNAVFDVEHQLTVNSAHGNPQGAGWYPAGANAAFSVTSPVEQEQSRFSFQAWNGDYAGTAPSGSLIMNEPKAVTATWRVEHYLTVQSAWGNPTGQGWYVQGQEATFGVNSAVPQSPGTRLALKQWIGSGSGSYSGDQPQNSVTMNNPIKEVAAWQTQYFLSTRCDPSWGGTILPAAPGEWYQVGAKAVISVSPNQALDYIFSGWACDLSGQTNPDTVIMNAPKTVCANFIKQDYILVDTNPTGLAIHVDGSEYVAPQQFQWEVGSTHTLAVDDTLSQDAATRHIWQSWSDNGDATHAIIAQDADTYVATFKTEHRIHLAIQPAETGSTTPAPPGGWYEKGHSLQISAEPRLGYEFAEWLGDISGTANPYIFVINEGKEIVAKFEMASGVESQTDVIPDRFALLPNYPNPFNPATTITFNLPKKSSVQLVIYNMRGERIKTLLDGVLNHGVHSLVWFGVDDASRRVESGMYIITVKADGFTQSVKTLLLN